MKLIDKMLADPEMLRKFSTPSHKIQTAVIKKNPLLIYLIKNPNPKVQQVAVANGGIEAYSKINNPSREASMKLAEVAPMFVSKLCKNIDDEIALKAIATNQKAVTTFSSLSKYAQLAAYEMYPTPMMVDLFQNPCKELYDKFIADLGDWSRLRSIPNEVQKDLLFRANGVNELVNTANSIPNLTKSTSDMYINMVLGAIIKQQSSPLSSTNLPTPHRLWKSVNPKSSEAALFKVYEYSMSKNHIDLSTESMFRRIFANSSALSSALTLML